MQVREARQNIETEREESFCETEGLSYTQEKSHCMRTERVGRGNANEKKKTHLIRNAASVEHKTPGREENF